MKKTIIAATLAAASLTGCKTLDQAMKDALKPADTHLTIGGTKYTASVAEYDVKAEFEFKSIDAKIEEINVAAMNNLWSKDKLSKRIDSERDFAGNGTFNVTGYSISIGEASDGLICALLVQDLEVIEKSCMNGVANAPSYNSSYWWNMAVVSTRKLDASKPFELRVNSSVTRLMTRYKFTPSLEETNEGK